MVRLLVFGVLLSLISTACGLSDLTRGGPGGAAPTPTPTFAPAGPGGGQEGPPPAPPTPPPGLQPTDDLELQGLTPRPPVPWRGTITYSYSGTFQGQGSELSMQRQTTIHVVEGGEGSWSGEGSMASHTQSGGCQPFGYRIEEQGDAQGSGKAVLWVYDYRYGSFSAPVQVTVQPGLQPTIAFSGAPGEDDATVVLMVMPDGSYTIDVQMALKWTKRTITTNYEDGIFCMPSPKTNITTEEYRETISASGRGQVDPAAPDFLAGSTTEQASNGATVTFTWRFTRG